MAAPVSDFVRLLCETMAALGDVTARRMFGGYGLYCDGVIFAIVADETLYLKTDAETRPAYEAMGLEPFRPYPGKSTAMPYHPPPDSALDDSEELLAWARPAVAVAFRTRQTPPTPRRRG